MDLAAPPLKTRLACLVYEALLLFGPVFAAGWLFSIVMQQRHALVLRHGMQAWLFFVLGMYFAWFWSHGRQTLPMKTWRIRLVDEQGGPVSFFRAALRYLLAWGWFLPGLALAWALDTHQWASLMLPLANILLFAAASWFDPARQFPHDRLLGTRLIRVQPADS
jgi:uncharacterized RDD family membrane protein YckC